MPCGRENTAKDGRATRLVDPAKHVRFEEIFFVLRFYDELGDATWAVTVDCGACVLSISNGWPGPQPATKNRVAAIRISVIVVFIDSLSTKELAHFRANHVRLLDASSEVGLFLEVFDSGLDLLELALERCDS